MTPWIARLLVRLYPASWRRRYGREFQALLEDQSRGSRSVASIVAWAVFERIRSVCHARTAFAGVGADLSYVLRGWRNAPAFSATIILTLVLGIGVAAAIFSFADGYLFRPLPFPSAGQLYVVSDPDASPGLLRASDVSALRQSAIAPFGFVEWNVSGRVSGELIVDDRAVDVLAYEVSPLFRATVPLPLDAGRDFSAVDHADVSPTPVWLSYRFWTRAFNQDRGVLGRRLHVRGPASADLQVVGVLGPEVASFDLNNRPPDIVLPAIATMDRSSNPNLLAYPIVRLPDGVSPQEGEAIIGSVLQSAAPDRHVRRVRLRSVREVQVAGGRPTARVFLASALLLLLLAALNLVHLLLSRGVARTAEVATRAALGASPWRIARVFLVEGLALAGVGIAGGLVLGAWLSGVIAAGVPLLPTGPRNLALVPMLFDRRVIVFAAGLGMAVPLLGSVWPLWRATRQSMNWGGRTAAGIVGRVPARASRWLLTSEIAVAMVVLVGTMSAGTGIWRYLHQPLGFDYVDRFSVEIRPREPRRITRSEFDTAVRVLRQLPGVKAVGPYELGEAGALEVPSGASPPSSVSASEVSEGYREAWGLRVLSGRWFAASEFHAGAGAAVVDRTFADSAWPSLDPLGQEVIVDGLPRRVVGVVEPRRTRLSLETPGVALVPASRPTTSGRGLVVWVPNGLTPVLQTRIETAIAAVLPTADVSVQAVTMQQLFLREIGEPLFQAPVMITFGLLAFLLAGIGVFGLVSQLVAQRTREIGVRLALGATPGHVWRTFVFESLVATATGLAIGATGAWWVESIVTSSVFGWDTSSNAAALSAGLTLLAAAVSAAAIPAARAMGVDPSVILRSE